MLQFDLKLCGECGGCVAVCSPGALELLPSGLMIQRDRCTLCENCVIFCPTGVLRIKAIPGKISSSRQMKMRD